ncbi:MAG: HD domain-containing phosphohydrolase [Longimicrobiales bacterium]|nr:HD domain-containing phosphohydrolase [Longimicrobiales bacterium]
MTHVDDSPDTLRIHTAPGEASDLHEMLEVDEIELHEIGNLEEVRALAEPTVLFLSRGLLGGGGAHEALRALPRHVVVVAADDGARSAAEQAGRLFLAAPDLAPGEAALLRALRCAFRHAATEASCERAEGWAGLAQRSLTELNKIGMALMSERDPERLLGMILTQARRLTSSDAGSLYLVEANDRDAGGGEPCLHFLRAQNDSIPDLPDPNFTLPISETSIAGFVASTAETLVIDDVYDLPVDTPYAFNPSFDEEYGYRARSMLVVPMLDHTDRVVGVLQLINRKRDEGATIRSGAAAKASVEPFTAQDVQLVQSLAGQAAVSIENGLLYRSIEKLFEGFIKASVTAIDQRDPATSGHSVRVAELTCTTARAIDEADEGPFADLHFTEEEIRQLRYAGLLHDIGKVGVREKVLVKERKLPPEAEVRVEARFELIRATIEAEAAVARVRTLDRGEDVEALASIEAKLEADLAQLDADLQAIRRANVPNVLDTEAEEALVEIAHRSWIGRDGRPQRYLTDEELHFLSIPRGSLDSDERRQIESHVIFGYDFLREIPWTDDLARIAEIVRGHHEKLNGKGYPDGVTGERLTLESRIMSVCDIFDALTVNDRPYKKAMPVETALKILREEAEEGALDPEIVELFVTSRLYERVIETDWREL